MRPPDWLIAFDVGKAAEALRISGAAPTTDDDHQSTNPTSTTMGRFGVVCAATTLLSCGFAYKNNYLDTRYQPIFRPPGPGSVGYVGDPNGMMYFNGLYHLFWQCKVGEIDGTTVSYTHLTLPTKRIV